MARGWESKSVEQQQEEAKSQTSAHKQPLTPEQILAAQKRQGLELSRKRILQQLETVSNPRHRQVLEAALKDLDEQLANIV